MVINDIHKFLFVHIPKAAGTSIMSALSAIEGNNKCLLAKTKHETLEEFGKNIRKRSNLGEDFQPDILDEYFTFGFVRNPWDRMHSFYRYLVVRRPRKEIDGISNFKDFLLSADNGVDWIQGLHSMRPQLDFIINSKRGISIDFLGHYEYLLEDFNDVISNFNLGNSISLPSENTSGSSSIDFKSVYDDEMIEIVRRRFSADIDFFGYSFDSRFPINRVSKSLRVDDVLTF